MSRKKQNRATHYSGFMVGDLRRAADAVGAEKDCRGCWGRAGWRWSKACWRVDEVDDVERQPLVGRGTLKSFSDRRTGGQALEGCVRALEQLVEGPACSCLVLLVLFGLGGDNAGARWDPPPPIRGRPHVMASQTDVSQLVAVSQPANPSQPEPTWHPGWWARWCVRAGRHV